MNNYKFLPPQEELAIRDFRAGVSHDGDTTFAELEWEWAKSKAIDTVLLTELNAADYDDIRSVDIEKVLNDMPSVIMMKADGNTKKLEVHNFHSVFMATPAKLDGTELNVYLQKTDNIADVFCRLRLFYDLRPYGAKPEKPIEEIREFFNPKDKVLKFVSRVASVFFIIWMLLLLFKACSSISFPGAELGVPDSTADSPGITAAQTTVPTSTDLPTTTPNSVFTDLPTQVPSSPSFSSSSSSSDTSQGTNIFSDIRNYVSGIRFVGGFFDFFMSTTGILLLFFCVSALLAVLYYFGRAQKSNLRCVALYLYNDTRIVSIANGMSLYYTVSDYGGTKFPVRYDNAEKNKPAAVFFAPVGARVMPGFSGIRLINSTNEEFPIRFDIVKGGKNQVM